MSTKKINIASIKGSIPVANQGMKLSKLIALDKIEEHEKFKVLYSIDEDLEKRITQDMKENKFDASQPVHIWIVKDKNGKLHFYLIDGYTRIRAAKKAGLQVVPYFEHIFETFEEALRYARGLQANRRNLSSADLLNNIEELMGSEYVSQMKGNKNKQLGEMFGVSEKTIERTKFVNKNASSEEKEKIKNGEETINSTYNKIKKNKKSSTVQEATDDSLPDSDALDDSSDTPRPISITTHSDGIERPTHKLSAEEDNERTRERKSSYELGFTDGFQHAAEYIFSSLRQEEFIEDIEKKIKKAKGDYNKLKKLKIADEPTLEETDDDQSWLGFGEGGEA